MPISGSDKALHYSLSGVERCGATRCGYTDARVYISIGGVHYATARAVDAQQALHGTLSITEVLDETPNTATLDVEGFTPSVGQEAIVTIGSKNNINRRFAGTILNVNQSSTTHRARFSLSLIDWTWRLDERLVSGYFTGSGTAIAKALMHGWAPSGYTAVSVETNLPSVDGGITFTVEPLSKCLTRLAKRIGGYWYIDYHKDLHFYITGSEAREGCNPPDLTAANTLLIGPIQIQRNVGQIITRVYVEGYGTVVLSGLSVGETRIPILDAATYFATGGGMAKCGTNILTYTGILAGGSGTLVGTGVSPAAGPTLALAVGAGLENGLRQYAVTFGTGGGESLPSPSVSVSVGTLSAPASGPTAGTPQSGSGPDAGAHYYAVTGTDGIGETTASPVSNTITTTGISAPSAGLTATIFADSSGVNPGAHDYAYTNVDGSGGETTASPLTSVDSLAAVSTPATFGDTSGWTTAAGSGDPGTHQWAYTFRRTADSAETALSPAVEATIGPGAFTVKIPTSKFVATPAGCTLVLYRSKLGAPTGPFYECTSATVVGANLEDGQSDASLGSVAPASNTAVDKQGFTLTNIATGPSGTVARRLYRTAAGAAQLKLLATLNDNSTTSYVDNADDSNLGANVPVSNTALIARVTLTAIPIGGAGITGRKIYRTAAGGAQLKLVHTLSDNSTTSWTDTVADASLGANIPVANTTGGNQVALSNIPIGGSGTTSRKVYRTLASGSQLKLVATIADNTSTTYTDSTADTSLGANVPTSDTSGLTQPDGQVSAGATELPCAGTSWASASGGWAVIGNGQQAIRYTGISGNDLTGIPSSGNGAITAAISYNSTITAAPCLTGIPSSGTGSVQVAITKGDAINVFVQRDDTAAQTTLAATVGGTGIREHYLQDRRLSIAECEKRGDALLALNSSAEVIASWTTRHPSTRPGRTQTVDLGAPTNTTADLKIQQVTTSDFQPGLMPTTRATASNRRYSFEDLINGESGA